MKTKSMQVKVSDEAEGKITAVFATLNVKDKHGDVTLPGAFEDGAEVVISAYNHASWGPARLPVGKGVIRTTDTEAILDGELFLNSSAGREHYEVLKGLGEKAEWSYGFDTIEAEDGTKDGETVQFLKKLKVHEVSPVILGAGVNTRTLAVKSADNLKFSEHITLVLTDVKALIDRAADVKAMRQEKGKDLGEESRDALAELEPALKRLSEVLAPADEPKVNERELLEIERARMLARSI